MVTLEGRGPLVVSYGMGVDSTAMLVGMHARGIRPDLILFADTGGEKPETYAYEAVMQRWLASVGFPPITTVKLGTINGKHGTYSTLEENGSSSKPGPRDFATTGLPAGCHV
jgi:hypothetical protein